ncbi:MAG: hypothetical protein JNL01_08485 [Bdellovibrionales bacterium]|nr:hypothetical protein [Bdellovibrionales bacterium]
MLIRLLLFFPISLAAYDGSYRPRSEWVTAPETLYHWAGRHAFEPWGKKIKAAGKLTFPYRLTQGSDFLKHWSLFKNKHGIFTWTDPVLGSQGGYNENYAANADLIVLKIRPGANALRLVSPGDDQDYADALRPLSESLKKVQLIEHITPKVHEWIILDPKAVEQFTARPDVTHPILAKFMLPYLENPFTQPPVESIHVRINGNNPAVPIWLADSRPEHVAPALFRALRWIYDNLDLNPEGPYSTSQARNQRSYLDTYKSPLHSAFTQGPWDAVDCPTFLSPDSDAKRLHELFKNLGDLNQRALGR